MKNSVAVTVCGLALFCFTGAAFMVLGSSSAEASGMPSIVVALTGTAQGEFREAPGAGGELTEQNCFDVDLLDPATGRVIGSGTDCLDLNSIVPIGDDGGFGINNTTFFHLPAGTIVSLSRTTIQPIENPGFGPTHITGEVSSDNNVMAMRGTGAFSNATGGTRLSGIVDMTAFGSENIITFDCLFVIDLD